MLNDPFVAEAAVHWSRQLLTDGSAGVEVRVGAMLRRALGREPSALEVDGLVQLVRESARLRSVDSAGILMAESVWADAAHAVFNLKEFLYVP